MCAPRRATRGLRRSTYLRQLILGCIGLVVFNNCTASESTMAPATVATITVSNLPGTLRVGETAALSASAKTASGQSLPITNFSWQSSNTGVASVSSSGQVTAMAVGSATITASAVGQSGSASVAVLATPVASVTVLPTVLTLLAGQSQQLTATTKDAMGNVLTGRTISWASSNASVAAVSTTGIVTGVSSGSTTITAISEGAYGTSTVSVTSIPVATIALSPVSASVTIGKTVQISATLKDEGGNTLAERPITWASANSAVATVSSSGLVSAVAVGTTTVSATVEGKSASTTITVTQVPVASISIGATNVNLTVGQTHQLTATVKDIDGNTLSGRSVSWTSNNAGVASVITSGLVTAVAPGAATITATSEGKSATLSFTVSALPVASVTVVPSAVTVTVGQTQQLAAVVKDNAGNTLAGRSVTWASANASVASVSATGFITAVGVGTVTVTATCEGVSAEATITVTVVPVASVSLSSTIASLAVGQTQQLVATVKDASGNALIGRTVTWSSSSNAVAAVSTSGLVTAVAAGSATITASSEGKAATATIQVSATSGAQAYTLPTADVIVFSSRNYSTAPASRTAAQYSATIDSLLGIAPTSGYCERSVGESGSLLNQNVCAGSTNAVAYRLRAVFTTPASIIGRTVWYRASADFGAGGGLYVDGQPLTFEPNGWYGNLPSVISTFSQGTHIIDLLGFEDCCDGGMGISWSTDSVTWKALSTAVPSAPVSVASVSVSPSTGSLTIGATLQLNGSAYDAAGARLSYRVISWASGDVAKVRVSPSGLVTALSAGTVTVTANSEGRSSSASITVNPVAVATLSVSPASANMTVGQTQQLSATAKDANDNILTGRTVTWTSSNTSVASVSNGGLVAAVGAGVVTITATCEGKTSSSSITVSAVPVASVAVSPATASLTVGQTQQLAATPKDASGNALTGRAVTWTSSNVTVATVSSTGLVTAVAVGTATITATIEAQSASILASVSPPLVTITVPGTANVFGYGVTTPAPAGGGGGTVAPVITLSVASGSTLELSATGFASPDGPTMVPPDGFAEGTSTELQAVPPISGYSGPNAFFLLGVFLPAGDISSLPSPGNLTYASLADYQRTQYSPGLRQVFFIGDGRSDTGVTQQFLVPTGATQLVLGFGDGYNYRGLVGGYFNNAGALTVSVRQKPQP